MTRKDFELIAATLKAQHGAITTDTERDLYRALVRSFADNLRATNQQFNRDRFIRACGLCPANLY